MRFRWLAALAVALLSTGLASAQKAPEPTVEIRLRSVNDLVDKFEYLAGLANKEDVAKQAREIIKMLSADGKGIEGVDPKQPIGAYAALNKEVETSPFVILLPVADQDRLLEALKNRAGVVPEKGDDGTLKVAVPFINELHLRFANGYLFVSQKAKDLDPKVLVSPKDYFAKDDGSVASVIVHIDRIPADLRTFLFGQFELGVNEERKKNAGTESAAEKQFKNLLFDAILSGVKGVTEDGERLSVRLFADAKTDDISADVTLTAKGGSTLAKNFTALGSKTSLPAGIVASADAAARGNVKVAVTDGSKKEFSAAIEALLADGLKNAPEEQKDVVKALVAAVGPTLKAGELDAAVSLIGPSAKGTYQIIGAGAVKDGKEIEKFVKKVIGDYGAFIENFVEFKFDVEKIGDFSLHQINLKQVDDNLDKIFGTKTIWLATSDSAIVASIEPDGAVIRKGLKAKAIPVAVVSADSALAKVLPLAQPGLKADELKALLKDSFGDGSTSGKDTAAFTIEGGKQLTVKFKVKGKAIRAGATLGELKGK
ncbi:Signal peptide protein OS=Rhodopirellula sallentina SM41 GN=RSSM_01409 PE=4 SV=1 [Gemmata massiliana]|uniref:Signal peptide protein n=1 Tax=Gemmata massiliana TaxID=1210884 RepID=A0A6P2D8Q4_9BACT|nr:hypothetical protein [Gemmata massiliana]VTR97598.1 Signal peptide protein OS=Rhodopirellula sallentina SM41 GN=RSSM_01409 PE=4 SV=1 [Gemmata massiliana]